MMTVSIEYFTILFISLGILDDELQLKNLIGSVFLKRPNLILKKKMLEKLT